MASKEQRKERGQDNNNNNNNTPSTDSDAVTKRAKAAASSASSTDGGGGGSSSSSSTEASQKDELPVRPAAGSSTPRSLAESVLMPDVRFFFKGPPFGYQRRRARQPVGRSKQARRAVRVEVPRRT